ncbi:hypothetical protein IAQ61_007782, partial [Plenodomus lingam]
MSLSNQPKSLGGIRLAPSRQPSKTPALLNQAAVPIRALGIHRRPKRRVQSALPCNMMNDNPSSALPHTHTRRINAALPLLIP